MEETIDIGYIRLFAGYALMLIPIYFFWYYKTGLVKDTIISILRMTVQLLLVGVYLEYIFDLNNTYLNIFWVILMSIIATVTIIRWSGVAFKMFFLPILIAGLISIAITDAYFLGFIINMEYVFDARYFIPITGMLLGNTIKNVILSINTYYKGLRNDQNLYRWFLANGATHQEALLPFMRDALKITFNPVIASTAITGLIALPGMMTGQILGGSDPTVAVKYQIMLMITIFSSSILNVVLAIFFSNMSAFDKFNNLRANVFK